MTTPEILGIVFVSVIGGCFLKLVLDIVWKMHNDGVEHKMRKIALDEIQTKIKWHLKIEHGKED